ncbi:monocarboxylate transporter 12-like [Ptychodera flava]|uniref:monocarboxylate transporter 12-like n=1 Tax=Ptychodera flava TaxID=63121 RepID=UPI00396A8566
MATQRQADYYWKWLIVCCAFYMQLYAFGFAVSRGVFTVEFLDYFGEGASVFSWIFMFEGLGGTVTGPVAGYAISKYGVRKVVLFSAILHTLTMGLSVFAESVPHLIVTFGIFNGIGLNIAYISGVAMIPQYFNDGYAFANGLAGTGAGCGMMVLPPLFVTLIETYGWHGALIVLTGFSANLFVCAAGMKPPFTATTKKAEDSTTVKTEDVHAKDNDDMRSSLCEESGDNGVGKELSCDAVSFAVEPVSTDKDGKSVSAIHDSKVESKKTLSRNKCSSVFRVFGLFIFMEYPLFRLHILSVLSYGVYAMTNPIWIVVRAVDIGIPRIHAATLLTCVGACSMTSRLLHGWFIDRGFVSPFTLLTLMIAVSAVANLVFTFTTSYAIMVVSCVFLGLSQGTSIPVYVLCARQLVRPIHLPSALGLLFATIDFACVMIPVQGKIFDVTEDSRHPLLLVDAFLLACTILSLMLCILQRKRVRRDCHSYDMKDEGTH